MICITKLIYEISEKHYQNFHDRFLIRLKRGIAFADLTIDTNQLWETGDWILPSLVRRMVSGNGGLLLMVIHTMFRVRVWVTRQHEPRPNRLQTASW